MEFIYKEMYMINVYKNKIYIDIVRLINDRRGLMIFE